MKTLSATTLWQIRQYQRRKGERVEAVQVAAHAVWWAKVGEAAWIEISVQAAIERRARS